MAIKYFYKGKNTQLTKDFWSKEFECKGDKAGAKFPIDMLNVQRLQELRDYLNAKITVNSGYRSKAYNKSIGGASNSQHLYGKAADITVEGYAPGCIQRLAKAKWWANGGVGRYSTFTHVDTGNKRIWGTLAPCNQDIIDKQEQMYKEKYEEMKKSYDKAVKDFQDQVKWASELKERLEEKENNLNKWQKIAKERDGQMLKLQDDIKKLQEQLDEANEMSADCGVKLNECQKKLKGEESKLVKWLKSIFKDDKTK